MVRHTQINLFDSIHQYGCGHTHLGLPNKFSISNVQCARTKLSYDAGFLHMGMFQQKQLIVRGIFQILVGGGTKSFLPATEFPGYEL